MEDLEKLQQLEQKREAMGETLPVLEQSQQVSITPYIPHAPHAPQQLHQHTYDPLVSPLVQPELVQSHTESTTPHTPQQLRQHTHNPLVSPLVHPVLIQSRDELTEEFKESEASKKLVTLKSQLRTFKKQYDEMRKQAAAVTAIFSKHKRR